MSQPRYLSVFGLLFFVTSCVHAPGYESNKVAGIKIIKSDQGKSLKDFAATDFERSFPRGEDGTKTIIDFLSEAKHAGASYVSDLELTVHTEKEVCTTFVLPEEEIKSKQVTSYTPGKYETKYVSKPVTRTVTENEYQCQYVQKPVQRSETYYENQYDSFSKTSRSVPRTRYVTKYESQNDCKYVPVTKIVTRYEYQYESQYVPPRTEYLTQNYSQWKLAESEPLCQSTVRDPASSEAAGKIRGTIYIGKK